nr:MAG TPA: hypothetical protein [Bacteriophage sp.]
MVGLKEGFKPSFFYAARYYLRNTKKYISIHPMLLFINTK